jgi:multisubunit Na+/H+ antiporter MnhE subunit
MKIIIKQYKLIFVLFSFWLLITQKINAANLILGLILSIIATIISNRQGTTISPGYKSIIKLTKYFFILIVDIYKASFSLIISIINNDSDPIIIEVDVKIENPIAIMIMANSITLTPGTLTVDTDETKLYILCLKSGHQEVEKTKKEVKERFERYLA